LRQMPNLTSLGFSRYCGTLSFEGNKKIEKFS